MPKEIRKKYSVGKDGIDKEILKLAKKYSTKDTTEFYRQMLTTVIKLYLDGADTCDLHLLNISLKELRHAFRMFRKYRDVHKVAIFGSARTNPNAKEYKMALRFAEKISKVGFMVITGGGGGVMEAGNKGALPSKSFAVNIQLPFEQHPNAYIKDMDKLMTFHYFFTRKLIFIKESDATVLFPGGFGTNDEAFEVLTLAQTGKTTPRPIVFVNGSHTNYWRTWVRFLKKEGLNRGFLSPSDFKIFKIVNTVDEALKEVVSFYKVYHSIRYVKDQLVVRLKKQISDSSLKKLNKKYSDIVANGKIMPSGPLMEEVRDKDCLDLYRIVLNFKRHDYGRLFEMVREINTF